MSKNKHFAGAVVERGIVVAACAGNTYIVESLDRPGIKSPPIGVTDGDCAVDDIVHFVLYPDGSGKIISKGYKFTVVGETLVIGYNE